MMDSHPTHCAHCREGVKKRLEAFASENQIDSGNSILANVLCNQVEHCYPGLFDLVQNPSKWIGEDELAGFPVSPEKVKNKIINIEAVNAPLPFISTVVTHVCPHCRLSYRIIHVGIAFYVLTSHVYAFLHGTGLSADNLAEFIRAMGNKDPKFSSFEAPQELDRNITTSAMAWLLCHEIGHFAGPDTTFSVKNDAPSTAQEKLNRELQADYYSFCMLMHRQQANAPLDKEALCTLFAGVALLLRSWHVIMPKEERRADIYSYGPRIGAATPSPTLRWSAIKQVFDICEKLNFGVSNSEYAKIERHLFVDEKTKIQKLWRKMDELGITA